MYENLHKIKQNIERKLSFTDNIKYIILYNIIIIYNSRRVLNFP